MKINAIILIFLSTFLVLISCKTDNESANQLLNKNARIEAATVVSKKPMMLGVSVYSLIEKNENLSLFANALPYSLKELLLGTEGPYTVFAPNNSALVNKDLNNLEEDYFKKYLVKGEMTTAYLVKRIREHRGVYTIITLAGTELKVMRDGLDIIIEDSYLIKSRLILTDYLAENGIVHVIEQTPD